MTALSEATKDIGDISEEEILRTVRLSRRSHRIPEITVTPRTKRRKRRAVVDTSVLVAGIAGFRDPYEPGRNPSADLLYEWAEPAYLCLALF